MKIDFFGKQVLITGAARGIGQSLCEAFLACSATVHAVDVLADPLKDFKRKVLARNVVGLRTYVADTCNTRAMKEVVAEAITGEGVPQIDILVCAAGGVLGQVSGPLEELSDADWNAIIDVNLTGSFTAARAVVPGMKANKDGRILFISSGAGLRTSLTGLQSYAAAKAGQIGLVRQLAQELGPSGIRVNAVAPGFMRTSPDYERQWKSYGENGQRQLIERIALRRLGKPEEVANAVMFLVSDYASFITGQTLSVNGAP